MGQWGYSPADFWALHPREFWWIAEAKHAARQYGKNMNGAEVEAIYREAYPDG